MFHRFIAAHLLLITSIANADANNANFIQQRALDPIKLQTGLPEAASRPLTPSELQVSIVHNNVFMGGRTDSERLILDGESSQVNLRYRQQINSCVQFNVSGAWLSNASGWFDNPVNDWHQLFGLPDAQRGEWPANQLDYSYQKGDRTQALEGENSGLGDVQLQVQHNLGCATNAPILRAGIKVPIVDADQFLGNGSVDIFVDAQSPWKRVNPTSRWQWAASLGLLKPGSSDSLFEQESIVGFGVAGVNVLLNPQWQLLGQLDWHTPMFKSDLRELSDIAVQLSLGLRYESRALGTWEMSFSEDAVIDTAPDIVVRLALTRPIF